MANCSIPITDSSCRLGPVRFSFVTVFEPKQDNSGKDKYSVCVMFPKTDKTTLKVFNDMIENQKQYGKSAVWGGKIPARLSLPLHDGDIDKPDKPEFAGMYYFNASTTHRPDVGVIKDRVFSQALDESEFYSGCWGAITVSAYPYSNKGNVGIGVGFRNVVKTQDDDKLGGRRATAEEDFADLVDFV